MIQTIIDPGTPAPVSPKQTEQARLRSLDCAVETARGRSVTEVYPDNSSGRMEFYWTSVDACGFRKPKVVPAYSNDHYASNALFEDGVKRFGGGGFSCYRDAGDGKPGTGAWFAAYDQMLCEGENCISTKDTLCEAICAAYLAACEAEKKGK